MNYPNGLTKTNGKLKSNLIQSKTKENYHKIGKHQQNIII